MSGVKTTTVGARMTRHERRILEAAARLQGMSLSAYVAERAARAARRDLAAVAVQDDRNEEDQ